MIASKFDTQRKTILHFCNNGTTNAAEIHSLTKIPLQTIQRNLKKIKDTGEIKRKSGSGCPKKITPTASRIVAQYIRRKPTISAGSIAARLGDIGVGVSRSTVSRHLGDHGY